MKRTILLLLVILFATPVFSQELFMQLTNKYADKEGFSATQITSDMFGLYLRKKNIEEGAPVYETLKKLDNILVASQSGFVTNDSLAVKSVHSEMLDYYKNADYTLFKTEKRMGEDIKVFMQKSNEKVTSLALVTLSASAAGLIEMNGDIDLSSLGEISKALNIRGLEDLNKINGSGSVTVTGYGINSPELKYNYQYYINSNERLEELKRQLELQHQLTDEQRKNLEKEAQQIQIRSREMAEKSRQMYEVYGRKPIFLSTPGDTNVIYILDGKKVKAEEIKNIDSDKIESIEVTKSEKKGEKNAIRITTKK